MNWPCLCHGRSATPSCHFSFWIGFPKRSIRQKQNFWRDEFLERMKLFSLRLNDLCRICWVWARTSNHRSPVTSALFASHNLCFRHFNNWIARTHTQARHTDLNGLHPWSWTDSPMLWSCLLCPANKTIACHCQHVKRSVRGETFWKPHLRRWADPVWVLDPSSAWLSTNTSRRQDERKRWLVLHVALPRLETQTWVLFLACGSVSHDFFREMACVSIYTSSGEIAS